MSRFQRLVERIHEHRSNHINPDFIIKISPEFRDGLLDEVKFSKSSSTDDAPYQFHGHDVVVDESIPDDSFYIEDE